MNSVPAVALPPTLPVDTAVPAIIADAGDQAAMRFIEFFTANIRNSNTRAAYARTVMDFFGWCDRHGVGPLPPNFRSWLRLLKKSGLLNFVKLSFKSWAFAVTMIQEDGEFRINNSKLLHPRTFSTTSANSTHARPRRNTTAFLQ